MDERRDEEREPRLGKTLTGGGLVGWERDPKRFEHVRAPRSAGDGAVTVLDHRLTTRRRE